MRRSWRGCCRRRWPELGLVAVISYGRSEEQGRRRRAVLWQGGAGGDRGTQESRCETCTADARPALPAGLSPEEHYWCEQCKAYHKRQPAQGQPAGARSTGCRSVGSGAPAPRVARTIPPLPAGLSAADYYWCTNCKAYHKRQPAQGQPGGRSPSTGGRAVRAARGGTSSRGHSATAGGLSPTTTIGAPTARPTMISSRQAPPATPAHPTPTPPPAAATPPASDKAPAVTPPAPANPGTAPADTSDLRSAPAEPPKRRHHRNPNRWPITSDPRV